MNYKEYSKDLEAFIRYLGDHYILHGGNPNKWISHLDKLKQSDLYNKQNTSDGCSEYVRFIMALHHIMGKLAIYVKDSEFVIKLIEAVYINVIIELVQNKNYSIKKINPVIKTIYMQAASINVREPEDKENTRRLLVMLKWLANADETKFNRIEKTKVVFFDEWWA